MTANEAPSNIIISFVKCTISYLFWYQDGRFFPDDIFKIIFFNENV